MRKRATYFNDYARIGRQVAVAASLLSAFVFLYALGTLVGVLQP